MTLTTIILLVLLLFVLHIFLQETSRYGFDLKLLLGNRDAIPPASLVAARLERAKNNMMESLPLFLGLALLALATGKETREVDVGAMLFLVARVAYLPIYAAGIPVLRSLAWLAAMGGMLMMGASIAGY